MKKQIFYNMLLTPGIAVSIFAGKKSYDAKNYYLLAVCIIAVFFFVWKKIELTREMRANFKKQSDDKNHKT